MWVLFPALRRRKGEGDPPAGKELLGNRGDNWFPMLFGQLPQGPGGPRKPDIDQARQLGLARALRPEYTPTYLLQHDLAWEQGEVVLLQNFRSTEPLHFQDVLPKT